MQLPDDIAFVGAGGAFCGRTSTTTGVPVAGWFDGRVGASYPDRFMELCERRGEAGAVVRGGIFKLYSGMVVPFGPADADYSLSHNEASRALRALGGTVLRTTTGFRHAVAVADWYAVICRSFRPVDDVASPNTRSKLRRALRNCEVRRICAEEMATSGYGVYRRAFDRYTGPDTPVAEDRFTGHIMAGEGFDDIIEHWAVFCDGAMAGYASNYIFGDIEAAYSTLKFDPSHLRRYTSYALFHRMNEHYLGERRVPYVNDGFRSIRHATELQPFLEHNFGFERAHVGIDAFYRQPYRAILRASFPVRNLIGRIDDRARAVYELESAVRASRMHSVKAQGRVVRGSVAAKAGDDFGTPSGVPPGARPPH